MSETMPGKARPYLLDLLNIVFGLITGHFVVQPGRSLLIIDYNFDLIQHEHVCFQNSHLIKHIYLLGNPADFIS